MFDSTHGAVAGLHAKLAVEATSARLSVEKSCATLWTSPGGLLETFRAGITKLVSELIPICFMECQFHANIAIDRITLLLFESAALQNSRDSTKFKDIAVLVGEPGYQS